MLLATPPGRRPSHRGLPGATGARVMGVGLPGPPGVVDQVLALVPVVLVVLGLVA